MFMVKQWVDDKGYPIYRYIADGSETPYSLITYMNTEGIKGEKGEKGDQGEQGIQGIAGTNGKDGITYVPQVGTVNTVDSVTQANVTVDVNTEEGRATFNFDIPKGKDGVDGTIGRDGVDGFSPVVTVTPKTDGHTVAIEDKNGVKNFEVLNGKNAIDDTLALVSNTPNLTLSITKNNPYWYGSFKLGYEYGSTPCEVTVTISSAVNYTVTKGKNTISKITYTQNGANYVFGIDFTATMYGTQVVEMPSEFGTINSLTSESFAGDTTATFIGYDGITYTTLAELGLTSSATIQNVMDALPVGGSCLIRTDSFDDTTQFMDVTWGYFKIEKTVNGLSKMEICDVVSDNKLYIGRQSSGKFNKWVALTTITSLSQLGITADTTLNDVIAKLGVGQTATLTTTEFTNYQTLFPYEEEQDTYATVRIEKGYDVNGSRTIVKWVRKDASKIAYGGLDSTNKVQWWNQYQVRNEIIYTSLTGNLSGITTVLDLVNALTTEYRSAKKPIRFVNGEINKTTLTDLPVSYGLLDIVVAGWDVVKISFAHSSYGFKAMYYGLINRTAGNELFDALTWNKVVMGTFNDKEVKSVTIDLSASDLNSTLSGLNNTSLANYVGGSVNVIKVEGYYIPPSDTSGYRKTPIYVGTSSDSAGAFFYDGANYCIRTVGGTNKGSGYAKIYYVE